MKIKKIKFKQLLKLHLIKSRVYEHAVKKTNFNDLTDANLDQILTGLKKALQIIFQYNQTNKSILFIGLPSKLELKINSLTRHVAISNSFNTHGIISNNNVNLLLGDKSSTQTPLKHKPTFLSLKLAKRPHLIVLFDHEKSHSVISEAWVAKIPVITFTSNTDSRDRFIDNSYFVNGNFKSILETFDRNIFFVGLNFLFRNFKKKRAKSFPISSNLESHLSIKQRKDSK